MFSSYRKIMARKAAGEMDETGFTLIELLIVIVVLGILAGVVIFALGGVTGQSAIAACKSDGATVSTALAAFNTDNPGVVATPTLLTGTTDSGPFLQSWPSSSHYTFSLDSTGVLDIQVMDGTPVALTSAVAYTGSNMAKGTGGCDDITG